jgi:phage FluMu protein Com
MCEETWPVDTEKELP